MKTIYIKRKNRYCQAEKATHCSFHKFRMVSECQAGVAECTFIKALANFWFKGLNNRPIRLTQCCTQFKSLGVKILCVLNLHDNEAFAFK